MARAVATEAAVLTGDGALLDVVAVAFHPIEEFRAFATGGAGSRDGESQNGQESEGLGEHSCLHL